MNTYNVHDIVVLRSTWKAIDPATGIRTLTTPDSADLTVTPPENDPYTMTIDDTRVVVDDVGLLHALVECTESGDWSVSWVGTGPAAGAAKICWTVRSDEEC